MESETTKTPKIPAPFTNIAVSLSGGGFRATAYHLGSLSYLDHRSYKTESLLKKVSILSTISGGTLTGIMYTLKLAQGKEFSDCFNTLYGLLRKNRLVDLALEKLNKPAQWTNQTKTRDLINAFSEVYNEEFFDGATFNTLYQGQQSHIKNAIFGASEFGFGMQFRFQETDGHGRFGNNYLKITRDAATEVRLADAAAASSCFPGGFEPMIMPGDFSDGPDSAVERAWNNRPDDKPPYPDTAVMDGGVIDNQGIEGVKLAESRNRKDGNPFIGTFLVSDVSAKSMEPYVVPTLKHGLLKNAFSIKRINQFGTLVALLIGALLLLGILPIAGVIAGTVVLTLLGIWFVVYFLINRTITKAVNKIFGDARSQELLAHLQILKKTPIYILIYLLKFRVTSVLKMTSDIFLRRIRQLQMQELYRSGDWSYRVKANNIYTLHSQAREALPEAMIQVIESANTMPTTLWFSQKDITQNRLDKLIACGQFTMCYNLINYIERLLKNSRRKDVWSSLDAAEQQHILQLHTDLKKDWEQFKTNPFWLLEKYKPDNH